jgi:tellurite resistance protein TerB
MSFGNNLKGWVNQQKTQLGDAITRFKNKEFMHAIVAGCALVAAADGEISTAEKQKMVGFIQRTDELKVFEMTEVIVQFNKFAEGFEFDAFIGKAEALKAISSLRNNPEAARLLIRVCSAIGMADGDFSPSEQAVVIEMCQELQLNPAEFNLTSSNTSTTSAPISSAPSPAAPAANTYKSHDKDFLEACIAVALLVAYADDNVQESEKQSFIDFARQHPQLQSFAPQDIEKHLKQALGNFSFNLNIGRNTALQTIAKCKNKADAAQALYQLGEAVAHADGHLDPREQAVLAEIKTTLAF